MTTKGENPTDHSQSDEFARHVEWVSHDPVINGIMQTSTGSIALLDGDRRVCAVNTSFLSAMGIDTPGEVLGLLPGEAIKCVHACEPGNECGTTPWCETCGAAIAIVSSLAGNTTEERKCVADVTRNNIETTLCFAVRSCIIKGEKDRFVLLFLQNISEEERRASLERIFLHDLNNIVTGLQTSSMLISDPETGDIREYVRMSERICSRLKSEVALQHAFARSRDDTVDRLEFRNVAVSEIIEELQSLCAHHYSVIDKHFDCSEFSSQINLKTEPALLVRILMNMVINAFEATPKGGTVRLRIAEASGGIRFAVWNQSVIPEKIRPRVFQQFFTTKKGVGRGFGTYGIHLIGEKMLGGTVGYDSSKEEGTEFWIVLPPG